MSKQTEIAALIRLLDDDDDIVIENVTNKLLSYGEEVIFNLENSWAEVSNTKVQERIESIIQLINFDIVKTDLEAWIASSHPDLYQGAEIVARYQFQDIDTESVLAILGGIKQKIWLELNNDLTPLELVSVFNQIFFGQFGFTCIEDSALDINDFCINYTIESKKGAPVLIGLVYLMLAQELNLPIYGVCLFNHFALSYQKRFIENYEDKTDNQTMFYINTANKGAVFGRQEIVNYLQKMKQESEAKNFKPSSNKLLIKELLVYISIYFEQTKQEDKLHEISQLLLLF